jgi:hypothetical protein
MEIAQKEELDELAADVALLNAFQKYYTPKAPIDSRMHSRFVMPELCKLLGLDHLHVKRLELVLDVQQAVQVNVTYFPRQSEWPESLRPQAYKPNLD